MKNDESKQNSCFSAIFGPSNPYENYPNKSDAYKKIFWLHPHACASMNKLVLVFIFKERRFPSSNEFSSYCIEIPLTW